jgi:hypothetical protein
MGGLLLPCFCSQVSGPEIPTRNDSVQSIARNRNLPICGNTRVPKHCHAALQRLPRFLGPARLLRHEGAAVGEGSLLDLLQPARLTRRADGNTGYNCRFYRSSVPPPRTRRLVQRLHNTYFKCGSLGFEVAVVRYVNKNNRLVIGDVLVAQSKSSAITNGCPSGKPAVPSLGQMQWR